MALRQKLILSGNQDRLFGTEYKCGIEDIGSDYQSIDNIKPNMVIIWQ